MKQLVGFILAIAIGSVAYAQNKTFGVGTSTLNPNAALQVDATNQGLQLPRLSTTQRTSMTLIGADKGLMVFDTDLNSIHTWDGTSWINAQKFVLPNKDSTTQALSVGARLLALKYKGTSDVGIAQFQNYSTVANYPVVAGLQMGLGFAGSFVVNNPANGGTALSGSTNSDKGGALAPVGVYGESTGTGSVGGAFWNTNPANTYPALYSRTLGTGSAASFEIVNTANTSPALYVQTNGTGHAISTNGPIVSTNASKTVSSGVFVNSDAANPTDAIWTHTLGTGHAIEATNYGTGMAGRFEVSNTANPSSVVSGITNGTGSAANFTINNVSNSSAVLYTETNGTGSAAVFKNTNSSSTNPLVFAQMTSNSSNAAMEVISAGTSGHAGVFNIFNSANSSPAIFSMTTGTGPTLQILQGNDGNALEVGQGGIKLSSTVINTGGTITILAAIYQITTTASVTLPAATNGQVCWVLNDSGGTIDLTNVGLTEPANGKIAQYVYIGQWRSM